MNQVGQSTKIGRNSQILENLALVWISLHCAINNELQALPKLSYDLAFNANYCYSLMLNLVLIKTICLPKFPQCKLYNSDWFDL